MTTTRIGYLGPENTFTHEAALMRQVDVPGAVLTPFRTIAELLIGYERGEVEEAVAPIENFIITHVTDTSFVIADCAINGRRNLRIVSELFVPVSFALIGLPGATLLDIRRVYSKRQALDQCGRFFFAKNITCEAADSTAAAAAFVLNGNDESCGALVSTAVARRTGMNILATECEDQRRNTTRFLVFGQDEPKPNGKNKTSLVLELKNEPGALFEVLRIFKETAVNLTYILSLSSQKEFGDYLFIVECDGHRDLEPLRTALNELKGVARQLIVLGSYPIGKKSEDVS